MLILIYKVDVHRKSEISAKNCSDSCSLQIPQKTPRLASPWRGNLESFRALAWISSSRHRDYVNDNEDQKLNHA